MKIVFFMVIGLLPLMSFAASTQYKLDLQDDRYVQRNFSIELSSETNPNGVNSLEYFIGNGVQIDANGDPIVGVAIGNIQRAIPNINHNWSFQFVPETVEFAEQTMELCDGNFQYVEDNYDNWIRDVVWYCPWNTPVLVYRITKNGQIIWQR